MLHPKHSLRTIKAIVAITAFLISPSLFSNIARATSISHVSILKQLPNLSARHDIDCENFWEKALPPLKTHGADAAYAIYEAIDFDLIPPFKREQFLKEYYLSILDMRQNTKTLS